jgi:hypothetical protein
LFFNTLPLFQRNTPDDNSDYGATSKADREIFLKKSPIRPLVPFSRNYLTYKHLLMYSSVCRPEDSTYVLKHVSHLAELARGYTLCLEIYFPRNAATT